MRIIVKILLSIVVLAVAVIIQAIIYESGNMDTGIVRLIPAAIMIFGLIGVWRYKPKKEKISTEISVADKTDLDKT